MNDKKILAIICLVIGIIAMTLLWSVSWKVVVLDENGVFLFGWSVNVDNFIEKL